MVDKQVIVDGCDVAGCEYLGLYKECKLKCGSCCTVDCSDNPDCYYKQLKRKEQECEKLEETNNTLTVTRDKLLGDLYIVEESLKDYTEHYNRQSEERSKLKAECERLKKKLKPKLKNAHCVYFDGQTELCKAKEFTRCNPIGCKLYTIDELSTIVDLQQQLDQLKSKNDELEKWKENVINLFDKTCRCKYLNEESTYCSFYNKECIAINQCLYKNQQSLTEIKEIIEQGVKIHDDIIVSKQILQVISEVK